MRPRRLRGRKRRRESEIVSPTFLPALLGLWMEKLFCQPFMLGARVLRRKSMSAAEKIFCVKAANVVHTQYTHTVHLRKQ